MRLPVSQKRWWVTWETQKGKKAKCRATMHHSFIFFVSRGYYRNGEEWFGQHARDVYKWEASDEISNLSKGFLRPRNHFSESHQRSAEKLGQFSSAKMSGGGNFWKCKQENFKIRERGRNRESGRRQLLNRKLVPVLPQRSGPLSFITLSPHTTQNFHIWCIETVFEVLIMTRTETLLQARPSMPEQVLTVEPSCVKSCGHKMFLLSLYRTFLKMEKTGRGFDFEL